VSDPTHGADNIRDALTQSDEQFRLLVEGVRDYAIFMLDAEGRVSSWNAGAQLIKGYTADEVIGRHFSMFYPPDALARDWPATELRRAAAEGRVEDEGWRIRKDGSRFWANVILTALRTEDGELVGFAKVTRDLTERRAADERLRRHEHQLAEAQAIAHLGSWDWDIRSDTVTWSDELYRIHGLEPGATTLTFETFFEQIHPDDRTLVRTAIDTALRDRAPFSLRHRIRLADGSVRILNARGQVDTGADGTPVRLFGTAQDITEQRRAEDRARELIREQAARAEAEAVAGRLRESEARFRAMADTAPVMVWTSGTDAQRDWFNRPWLEFTGRSMERELGSGWAENVHEDDRQRSVDTYLASFERRVPFRMEYRLRRRDAVYRWVVDHGVPRHTPDGEFAGFIGSCIDIHDRIEQQRALEENTAHLEQVTAELEHTVEELQLRTREEEAAREEAEAARRLAEDASRAKSQFLAVMSHELRTPLNAIMGFADLMAGEIAGPLTEMQRQQLARIQASSLHLLELINRVLSLSRIEAGRDELYLDDVDITALARECAEMIEPATSRKGLALHLDLPDTPVIAQTDAGKVRQIVLNLLTNAVKYTDSGHVALSLDAGHDEFRVRVSDTGIGIPQEYLPRIFTPFTQVEASSSRGRGGTGLGLSVTRELARTLGGDVEVESEPDGGSTFTVRLPLSAADDAADTPAA
jgi:PAS domain S-box-containing protein